MPLETSFEAPGRSTQTRSRFRDGILWLDSVLIARPLLALVLFSFLFWADQSFHAMRKPLWYDEICQYLFARQPLGQIWQNLGRAVEVHPPLSFWLMHFSMAALGQRLLAMRLPMLFAFWIGLIALYAALRRYVTAAWSLAALFFVLLSGAGYYATEARPYALVFGAAMVAFWAWQEWSGRPRWFALPLLALALAIAVSSHYLAVLLWIPLAIGELVRTLRLRRIDWGVWIAFAIGLAPLAAFYPFMKAARDLYAAHNANPARFVALGQSYDGLFQDILPILLGAFLLVAWWRSAGERGTSGAASGPASCNIPAEDFAASGSFLLLPIFAFAIGHWTNSLHLRYVVAAVPGGVLFLMLFAARYIGDRRGAGTVCLLAVFTVFACFQVYRAAMLLQRHGDILADRAPAQAANEASLPIVVETAVDYLPLWFHAEPVLQKRLMYVAWREGSVRSSDEDTLDLNMLGMRRIAPLNVIDYPGPFGEAHARFLLFVTRPDGWMRDEVVRRGGRANYVRKAGVQTVYLVEMP